MSTKITVIGAGSVGSAITNDIMVQGIASEVVLMQSEDVNSLVAMTSIKTVMMTEEKEFVRVSTEKKRAMLI